MDFTTITEYDLLLIPALGGEHCAFADSLALSLTSALTWIPLYLALLFIVIRRYKNARCVWHVVICAGLCILLADGMADGIVKPLTERLRPLNDPEVSKIITLVAGAEDSNFSFFSAHAANTFSICVFFSLLMRNKTFMIFMTIWSLTNCWTRIYLGMHYPSDIFIGLLWGSISGTLAYYTYKATRHKVIPVEMTDEASYSLPEVMPAIATILITIVVIIIHATI